MKNTFHNTLSFLAIIIFPFWLSAQSHRYYVDVQASGQFNGQSWTDAFTNLHDALVLALPGDEIWVAEGIYHPAATDRTAYYQLPSGVRLYGGFAGTEMLLSERQPTAHASILSGDIGTAGDSLDNSYTLLYLPYPNLNTLVDGFTLRDAVANNPDVGTGAVGASGAALYIQGQDSIAYPTIQHCIFEHNTARTHGGAVYINGSGTGSVAPYFEDCQFWYNRAILNGGAVYRDGASWWERPADYSDCTFEYNRAKKGGCIYVADAERSDSTQIVGTIFRYNYAVEQADVMAFGRARQQGHSVVQFNRCTMAENLNRGIFITDVLFTAGNLSVAFDSSTFYNDISTGGFGSIRLTLFGKTQCKVDHCSFSANAFNSNPSIHYFIATEDLSMSPDDQLIISHSNYNNCKIQLSANGPLIIDASKFKNSSFIVYAAESYAIKNSIFNKDTLKFSVAKKGLVQNSVFFKNYIFFDYPEISDSVVYINNCIFWRLADFADEPGHYAGEFSLPFNAVSVKARNCLFSDTLYHAIPQTGYINVTGPGIQIGLDPLFVDTLNGDFHLQPCSPGWNAGDNASTLALGLSTDLDGRPRIADGLVDIGAYEVSPLSISSPANVQAACFDLPQGGVQWNLQNGCPPFTYDWNSNGNISHDTIGLLPGNYVFTITDNRGRTLVQSVLIPTSSPQIDLSGDTLICPAANDGDLLALVSGAIEPLTYYWSNGSSAGSIDHLSLGAYSVTVTDAIGCRDTATAKIVSLSLPLDLSVQTGLASTLTTPDGSLAIIIQSGQPPYTYAWAEVPSTSPTISGLLPGIYHLSVTDGSGCTTPFQFEVGVVSGTNAPEALVPGSVQPNPVQGQALLRFGDGTCWQLFNAAGLEVMRVEFPSVAGVIPIDLNELPAGLYFYTFSDRRKVISRDRLVIFK